MHFTYRQVPSGDDLHQGDVLRRTEQLNAVLAAYHAYYLKEDYTHFMIITQSCDLVQRPKVKAEYIALAPVRPLSVVLDREAEQMRTHKLLRSANALERAKRPLLKQFLEKLLNNNNTEFFYLHDEPEVGMKASCVFMRLPISIRNEHYDACREARLISLEKEFQAKLGWLVGNLYSRVGTEDWTPVHYDPETWQRLIDQMLDESFVFVDDQKAKIARQKAAEAGDLDRESARKFINDVKVPSRREAATSAILDLLQKENLLADNASDKVRFHLQNSPTLSTFFK